jgi:hypothetical protein
MAHCGFCLKGLDGSRHTPSCEQRWLVHFLGIAAAVMMTAAGRLGKPVDGEPEEIARFNDCIQKRFLGRKTLGMQRVAPMTDHDLRLFVPENPTEQTLVDGMREKGYEVVIYLAGRGVLEPNLSGYRSRVQGPGFVTKVTNPESLPTADALLEESRKALLLFQPENTYRIRKDEWEITMRPLRASNDECIGCHMDPFSSPIRRKANEPPLKIGDTLGVAMYVYRRLPGF